MSRLCFPISSAIVLCALPFFAVSAPAQGKKSGGKPAAQRPGAPAATATAITTAPRVIPYGPLLIGGGAGVLLGIALGSARGGSARRKKTPTVAAPIPKVDLTIFDEAPFPLALIDESERIARANASFSHLLGVSDAGGTSWPQWVHPDDLPLVRAQFHEVAGGQRALSELPTRLFLAGGELLHTRIKGQKAALFGAGFGPPKSVLLALQDVTPQIEAQQELVGARAAITALYELMAGDHSRDLDSKLRSLLAMGCGRFELPIGVLGRINGDEFETLFVQSPDRRVRPALQLRRGDESPEAHLLGLSMLPTSADFRAHPFVCSRAPVSYLGAPVVVNGALFGMLSFSGAQTQVEPHSSHSSEIPSGHPSGHSSADAQLLQLMAEWVGGEIERDLGAQALEKQQKALLEANRQLEMLATHDPLTGAKNRRAFNEKLEEEWSRARRYSTPLSLVLMDVDKFKTFNDTFGHPAGDEVLKRVARVLMGAVRTTDFFARYGGEEFVLILPNTDAEGALILANRLREKIEQAPWKERQITASMGVSTLTPDFKTSPDLTQAADDALYAAKERGRNRVTHARDLEVLG